MNLIVLLLVATQPGQPGVTTPFETVTCSGEMLAGQSRAEWLSFRSSGPAGPGAGAGDFSWVPVDSLFVRGEFGAGKRLCVSFCPDRDTLELAFPLDTLPLVCRQALDYAPTWLREELTHAFFKLGDSAEFYANLLLAVPAPYTDEVAFCIATVGPLVLTHRLFNPDLLLENARQLYQIDDSIQYADIVERGSQPGDYYSTVRYAVASAGDTVWRELPRDIYYYYVVHPTTSDELPRMDPYVCNKHWREYFFFDADSGYPVLADYVKQARVVWSGTRQVLGPGRPFDPGACALDVIGNWATRTVPFAASGNRPVHPQVIAHEHNGNCGELQDVMTAACRTCLIPAVNTMDPCEDHVWSEFWDQGWYPYQADLGFGATHIADTSVCYDEQHGGSKRVSSIWDWRPDGLWWTVTRKYSNTCSLYVRVLDLYGLPIDGARVLLYSEGWYGGFSVTTASFTDDQGAVAFELGELRHFYVQVTTPLGSWPSASTSVKIINMSQTGAVYFSTLCMPYALGAPKPRYEPFTGDSSVLHRLDVSLGLASGFDCGYCNLRGAGAGDPDETVRVYQNYAARHPQVVCDLFLSDTTGYAEYLSGQRFGALWLGDNIPGQALSFACPDPNRYHLIFSTEDKLSSARQLDLAVRLYLLGPGIAETGVGTGQDIQCPSLVRDRLRVAVPASSREATLRVYDRSGQRVAEQRAGPAGSTYEMRLPAGVYFVRLEDQSRTLCRRVVVVR